MRKFMKIISLILTFSLCISFFACGNENQEETGFTLEKNLIEIAIDEKSQINTTNATGLTFTSTDENVATVSETGEVHGLSVGECKVKVTANEGIKYCIVKVVLRLNGAYSIRFNRDEYLVLEQTSFPYNVELFKGSEKIENANVTTTSSNERVFSVENGNIVAKEYGIATLTATCEIDGETIKNTAKIKVVFKNNHDPIIVANNNYNLAVLSEYVFADNISFTENDGSEFKGESVVRVYTNRSLTQELPITNGKFTVQKGVIYYVNVRATSGEFSSQKTIKVSDGTMINGSYEFENLDVDDEFGANADTSYTFIEDETYGKILKVKTEVGQPYTRALIIKNLHSKVTNGKYVRIRIKFENIVSGVYGYTDVYESSTYIKTFSKSKVEIPANKQGEWVDIYFLVENARENGCAIEFYDDGQMSGVLYKGLTFYIAQIQVVDSVS